MSLTSIKIHIRKEGKKEGKKREGRNAGRPTETEGERLICSVNPFLSISSKKEGSQWLCSENIVNITLHIADSFPVKFSNKIWPRVLSSCLFSELHLLFQKFVLTAEC